jgi:RimJ/RimL family protein N-acetyltransferase
MKLVPVDKHKDAVMILYDLLSEREKSESISHKSMPIIGKHREFIASNPYLAWYLIEVEGDIVGATYLTRQRELGIGILKAHRGHRYGKEALRIIMHKHPGRFLANINPANEKSIKLFGNLGFGLIQHTYEL